jgi:hypothetical protein
LVATLGDVAPEQSADHLGWIPKKSPHSRAPARVLEPEECQQIWDDMTMEQAYNWGWNETQFENEGNIERSGFHHTIACFGLNGDGITTAKRYAYVDGLNLKEYRGEMEYGRLAGDH